MRTRLILAAAALLTLATSGSMAQPGSRGMMNDRYYQRVAAEYVQLYLRRNPTQYEVLLVTNQLRSGMSAHAVQANILGSDEYYRANNRNLNAWAQRVVSDTLGRRITFYELGLLQNLAVSGGRSAAALLVLDSRVQWSSPPWWWGY